MLISVRALILLELNIGKRFLSMIDSTITLFFDLPTTLNSPDFPEIDIISFKSIIYLSRKSNNYSITNFIGLKLDLFLILNQYIPQLVFKLFISNLLLLEYNVFITLPLMSKFLDYRDLYYFLSQYLYYF